jgi:hypothetical protein
MPRPTYLFQDGVTLAQQLPQVIADHVIRADTKFSHVSFITRKDAVQLVYEPVIEILMGFL